MKPTKRLATKTEMNRNLVEARKLLSENKYHLFSPAEMLGVRNGFVAINWFRRGSLLPGLVLVRSRGSFVSMQFDDELFSPPLLRMLRKTLWVPIHVGTALNIQESSLKDLILADEHAQFDASYPNARR